MKDIYPGNKIFGSRIIAGFARVRAWFIAGFPRRGCGLNPIGGGQTESFGGLLNQLDTNRRKRMLFIRAFFEKVFCPIIINVMQRHKAMSQIETIINFREILNLFDLQKIGSIKIRAVFGVRDKETHGTLSATFAAEATVTMIINGPFTLSLERFENEGKNFLLGTHSLSGLNSDKGNITAHFRLVKRWGEDFYPGNNLYHQLIITGFPLCYSTAVIICRNENRLRLKNLFVGRIIIPDII